MQTLIKSKLVCNTIKVYFKARNINRDIKEGHFIKIKVSLYQGDIFIHLFVFNSTVSKYIKHKFTTIQEKKYSTIIVGKLNTSVRK